MTHPSGKPCENTRCRLTINPGEWDYDHWGHPGEPGVGSGVELWAWMGHGAAVQTSATPQHRLTLEGIQNSLSGLFCASLGSMDVLHTTSPAHAILPTADLPRPPAPGPARDAYTLYPMPHHAPRRLSHAGAAALLKPNRIFDVESPTGMV
ncbi:hypothetical protein EDB84DRAFT_1445625 [Lactarius hengduanensis]|nr:hypothetical protein EDB84DRAFT_1445625 [Lactarius hengduanensis]